jgi:hypothetical protein
VEVFDQDEYLGKSPLVISVKSGENKNIRLELNNYQSQTIVLSPYQKSIIHVQMQPKLGTGNSPKIRKGLSKTWLFVGSATALISGIAGYMFKWKADRAYDRYLATGHPDSMEGHYQDAITYDKWSSILYGFGEALFSLIFLLLMTKTWSL